MCEVNKIAGFLDGFNRIFVRPPSCHFRRLRAWLRRRPEIYLWGRGLSERSEESAFPFLSVIPDLIGDPESLSSRTQEKEKTLDSRLLIACP